MGRVATVWPSGDAYQNAVLSPRRYLRDPRLHATQVETAFFLGSLRPRLRSGNFGAVYRFAGREGSLALKVFYKAQPERSRRYALIHQYLSRSRPCPGLVSFRYDDEGILIHRQRYPTLVMDWVQGQTLDAYLQARYATVENGRLCQAWAVLVQGLQQRGIAHGDLQHGNVLVLADNSLKLVDYDGMFVPPMARQRLCATETGLPSYQHPGRGGRKDFFNERLDDFAALVVLLTLACVDTDRWTRFHKDDNCLLFRRTDWARPAESPLLNELRRSPSGGLRTLAGHLASAAAGSLEAVPRFGDVLRDRSVQEILHPAWRPPTSRPAAIPTGPPPVRHPGWVTAAFRKDPPVRPHGGAHPATSRSRVVSALQPAVAPRPQPRTSQPARAPAGPAAPPQRVQSPRGPRPSSGLRRKRLLPSWVSSALLLAVPLGSLGLLAVSSRAPGLVESSVELPHEAAAAREVRPTRVEGAWLQDEVREADGRLGMRLVATVHLVTPFTGRLIARLQAPGGEVTRAETPVEEARPDGGVERYSLFFPYERFSLTPVAHDLRVAVGLVDERGARQGDGPVLSHVYRHPDYRITRVDVATPPQTGPGAGVTVRAGFAVPAATPPLPRWTLEVAYRAAPGPDLPAGDPDFRADQQHVFDQSEAGPREITFQVPYESIPAGASYLRARLGISDPTDGRLLAPFVWFDVRLPVPPSRVAAGSHS